MLNEFREFYEYSFSLAENKENPLRRIKYDTLTEGRGASGDGISGLERFLTIIARGFMPFDVENYWMMPVKNQGKMAAGVWLGSTAKQEEAASYPDFEKSVCSILSWFPKYLLRVMIEDRIRLLRECMQSNHTSFDIESVEFYLEGIQKNLAREDKKHIEAAKQLCKQLVEFYDHTRIQNRHFPERGLKKLVDCLTEISDKCRNMENDSFKVFEKRNTVKLVTYDKIISRAAREGALRRWYLLGRKGARWFGVSSGKKKSLNDKEWDVILKATSAVLLEAHKLEIDIMNTTRKFSLNGIDLRNWLFSGKGELEKYTYFQAPLFDKGESITKNEKSVKIHPEWLKSCEWQLIDGTDSDDELNDFLKQNPDFDFYRDDGAGAMLRKNVFYTREQGY